MYQDNLDGCPPDYLMRPEYYRLDNTNDELEYCCNLDGDEYKQLPKSQAYLMEEYPKDHSKKRTPEQWIWTTRDGEELFVDEMDTKHIKNCVKMIYREEGAVNCFTAFIGELIKRGEI